MNAHYPQAFDELLAAEKEPRLKQIIQAVRDFDAADWHDWICDRLQGRDALWLPYSHADEEPDYLFRELIPQLGTQAIPPAISGAVIDCLQETVETENGWDYYSTTRLVILAGDLELVDTADALLSLLEYSQQLQDNKPTDFKLYSDDLRFQLLSALANLCRLPGAIIEPLNWAGYAELDWENYSAPCFYGAWKQEQWQEIGTIVRNIPERSDAVKKRLEMELYNLFDETVFDESIFQRLSSMADSHCPFKQIVNSALHGNEGGNGWPKQPERTTLLGTGEYQVAA